MSSAVSFEQAIVVAVCAWVLFAFFVAWAKYERWLRQRRRRRTGDVEFDPSCSRRGRSR
jgi:hypothetical protein